MQTVSTKSELICFLLDLGFQEVNSFGEYIKIGKEKSILVTPSLTVNIIKSKNCESLDYHECSNVQEVANVVSSYLK